MRLKLMCVGATLALMAQVATAEVTATATATTDYDFRGVSQTEGNPALQLSVDYAAEHFYAGIWGSNIDFGENVDGNVEVDLVAGFAGGDEEGLRWDFGATWYTYPASEEDERDPDDDSDDITAIENYMEYFAGLGLGPVDVKYWYAPDLYDSGEKAHYVEANASFGVPWELSLNLHAGYSFGPYFDELGDAAALDDSEYPGDDADYYDYSVGLGRSFGHWDFDLKYVGNITDGSYFDIDSGAGRNDERVIFSVSTTFPWGNDDDGSADAAPAVDDAK